MSGTSPLLILFRNCLSPIFWLLYLENGISVFFRFFLSWNCYRHHNRCTSSCKEEHGTLGRVPHGDICSQCHNRGVGFQIPTRLCLFPFCVCMCTLVSPVKAGVSTATVQVRSSFRTARKLVLAFDSQIHIPPMPRAPGNPSTWASSLKLTWQENYVESYTVCCVTFQDQLCPLSIIPWRFIIIFKILSKLPGRMK